MRKVLTSFEIFSQPNGPIGKLNHPIHWVMFAGIAVWYFALFVSDLGHSELEFHSVYFFRLLTL